MSLNFPASTKSVSHQHTGLRNSYDPSTNILGNINPFPIYFCRLSSTDDFWCQACNHLLRKTMKVTFGLELTIFRWECFFTLVMSDRYRLCLDSERKRPTFQKIACCSSWSLLPIDNAWNDLSRDSHVICISARLPSPAPHMSPPPHHPSRQIKIYKFTNTQIHKYKY